MTNRIQAPWEMTPSLRRLSRDFQALRAVVRLRILAALGSGESNVADLGALLRISQPLLSWHLKELRMAGFVQSRRVGREVLYRLEPARFCDLIGDLESLVGFSLSRVVPLAATSQALSPTVPKPSEEVDA